MVRPDAAKIVVPRKHGQVLIEPGLDDLAHGAGRGIGTVNTNAFGGKFQEMREVARAQLAVALKKWSDAIGHAASLEGLEDKRLVLTGHQVEFYHAGVWAKVIAA